MSSRAAVEAAGPSKKVERPKPKPVDPEAEAFIREIFARSSLLTDDIDVLEETDEYSRDSKDTR